MKNKEVIIKGGYYVEVSGSDGKKVIWELVDDNVVDEGKDHAEIGIQVFDFNFLTNTRKVLLEKD